MDQNDLGAVVGHQLAALHTDRVGHNDFDLIAAHGADKSKADALIAGGGFHNDHSWF